MCLHEKWANITNPNKNEILNKRPEFFCRYHKQKESHCQIHCCWFLWEIKTLISFKMLSKENKIKNKKQSRIQLITYFGVFTYYTYVSVYSCVNVCIFKCSCTCVCVFWIFKLQNRWFCGHFQQILWLTHQNWVLLTSFIVFK